jgi:hypothetical protein
MWLSHRLESCAFNALGLVEVVRSASVDLELDAEEVIRLLVRLTRAGSTFKSDGDLVTFGG